MESAGPLEPGQGRAIEGSYRTFSPLPMVAMRECMEHITQTGHPPRTGRVVIKVIR